MHYLGWSSMACFWFLFRLLCIICCIIAVTTYKNDYHSSIDNRNKRAVTEWRFRRNYLNNYPYFFRNHHRNNYLINNEENYHDNQDDEMKTVEKKIIIPQLMYRNND